MLLRQVSSSWKHRSLSWLRIASSSGLHRSASFSLRSSRKDCCIPLTRRSTPAMFQQTDRSALIDRFRDSACPGDGIGVSILKGSGPLLEMVGALRSFSAMSLSLPANTRHSINELLASLLAPCTPVHATSPTAKRPGMVVAACRSVATPPIQ